MSAELKAIRTELKQIRSCLERLEAKDTREWIADYYSSIGQIPNFFTDDEWLKSEQLMHDSMVKEINGYFTAIGTFHSTMRKQLLKIFKTERTKVLAGKARLREQKKG